MDSPQQQNVVDSRLASGSTTTTSTNGLFRLSSIIATEETSPFGSDWTALNIELMAEKGKRKFNVTWFFLSNSFSSHRHIFVSQFSSHQQ